MKKRKNTIFSLFFFFKNFAAMGKIANFAIV